MLQGGLDMDYVAWKPFDGIGRDCRVGLNFTERGYGVRAAVGCSDRGLSAACQMKPGEVDWDALFGRDGRALVPYRRHLRGPFGNDQRRGAGSRAGRPQAREHRFL